MKTGAVLTAQAIRQELKTAFPQIKFRVTSKSYSGGDSVDIDWTDGVTTKEVEAITNKYQYGNFNGMEDIYEYSNSRNDIPQAKYIFANRSASETVWEKLMAEVGDSSGLTREYELNRRAHEIFNRMAY